MHVTIDLTPTIQEHAGLGRLAGELAIALQATCPADEQLAVFYTDPQGRYPAPPLAALPRYALTLANKPWRLKVGVAHLLRQSQDRLLGPTDIFLATDHLLPYLKQAITLFTLGDLTFLSHPQTHALLNRTYLRLMMPHFLRTADAIMAISASTLREAQARFDFIRHKSHVVYPAVNHQRFQPVADPNHLARVQTRYHLPARFLLYVGTIEPRKNLSGLFEALKQVQADMPDLKLVIAGKKGWLYRETFARLQSLGLVEQVIFTGFVADDDLPAIYSLAEAFVFPSLYEGFGLPILEAMACGTPVLCSNTSSLPEVAGDAAVLLPPTEVRAWVEAITQTTQNQAFRADLHERGLHQAARFTWQATAQQTRQIYREIYAHRS